MADNLTTATIDVRANTRGLEKDILKALKTVEFSEINTKKSSQALGRITGQVSEFNKSLEASNARVVAFGASAGAIFAVERALSALITSTIEVEKSLTDINVLLNLSTSNLEKFGKGLFDVARNTSQSFSAVAEAANELARQGLGVEETLKRTNAALVLTRLSGMDAKTSVETLTATLNSFSGTALDAVEVVNKLANVDAAFAVSSGDLANAISRVGSTAQDAGVSLDELIALVTSAQQTTARGGAVIGNSFKTIFTRLQRGKVQDLLTNLGINTGEGESAISLLSQLAKVYDTLGEAQKSSVAEQVGGVFQINILRAALGDLGKEYSTYGQALKTSLSATDEAIRRNELLNQTVSALSSQTVTSLQQAADKIGSIVFAPNAKSALSGFNKILESFNNIDSESAGGKLMEGFFTGVGNFISGPGAVLATGVLVKLFAKLAQFASGSAKELLGRNEASKQQVALEQSVLAILQKNSQFTNQILSGKMTTVQAEKQLLDYLTAQSNILKEQERLSKIIGANLGKAGVSIGRSGIPMTSAPKTKAAASGYVPNFASDMAVGQAMENAGAKQHGYKAGKARKTTIHDGNGKSFKSFVNSKEDVKTFTNAAGKKATVVRPPNGFGENTQYAANGFIPNFAEKRIASVFKSGSSLRGLYDVGPVFDMYNDSAILKYQSLPKKYEEYRQEGRMIFEEARKVYNNSGQNINEANKYLTKRIPGGFGKKLNKDYFDKPFSENAINPIVGALGERDFFSSNPDFSKLEDYVGPDFKKGDLFAEVKILRKKISEKKLLEKALRGAAYSSAEKTFKNEDRDVISPNLIFASAIKESMYSGFVPNFAKMQDFYKNLKEKEGGADPFGKRASKVNKIAKTGVPVKDLGSLPYTMIHAGGGGNFQSSASFLKKDKKTNQQTQYLGKIWTAGLDQTKLKGASVQKRVGDALVTEANNLSKIFNPSGGSQFSNPNQLSNSGSVFSAAGTVFESAIRSAFNVSAQGQSDRIDFPNPSSELRSFFGNAPGSYEAKIENNDNNRSSALSKYIAVNGLSSGFIPNFAKSGLSFSHKDKDEFGFSEIQAIMGGKKVGSFSYAEDKPGQVDVGDFTVNKSERGKGIGAELYKEAIRRNAGKKMRGQLLPQMNRLLQKIKNGEPVSAETLYPQIKRADLAKDSVFEVYGHKGMTVEKMTRDQFSSFVNAKINELKKDPKKLQSYFGNVEADEYGGLGVDLQTQHASGFIPNFAAGGRTFNKYASAADGKTMRYVHPLKPIFNPDGTVSFPMMPGAQGAATVFHREAPFGQDKMTAQEFQKLFMQRRDNKRFWERNTFEYINNAGGFIPNFSAALNDAIAREQSAGLSKSQIYVDSHSSLKNKNNPMGLMVANTRDEPMGGIQGIKRAKREGRNPKTYGGGMSSGFIPNFAVPTDGTSKLSSSFLELKNKIQAINGPLTTFTKNVEQGSKTIANKNIENKNIIPNSTEISDSVGKKSGKLSKAKDFISNNALSIGFGAQAAGDIASKFAGQENDFAKALSVATSGLGTFASFASTGSLFGPWGTAIGAAVGATVAITDGIKAYKTKIPDLTKASEAASETFNKFSETGQSVLSLSERYADLKNSTDPTAAAQLVRIQEQYTESLLKLTDAQRTSLVSAIAQGKGQEEYNKIAKELADEQKNQANALALGSFAEGKGDKKSIQGIGKDLASQIAGKSGLSKDDLSNLGRYLQISKDSGARSNMTMVTAIQDALRQGSISEEGKKSLETILPEVEKLKFNDEFAGEAKSFTDTLAKLIEDIKSGKIEEATKSLEENVKRANEAKRKEKEFIDKNNLILLNLSSSLNDASSQVQSAVNSFIDNLKFKNEFKQKRGEFRSSFFEQAGAGRAAKSEQLRTNIESIRGQGREDRANNLAEAGESIADGFTSVIQSLEFNDKAGLSGEQLQKAQQDFEFNKKQMEGKVLEAQTKFYSSGGDTETFKSDLGKIKEELSKNITETESRKLQVTTEKGFNEFTQNQRKQLQNEQQQMALLAQSNAYQAAMAKLTQVQNFGGGATTKDILTGTAEAFNINNETRTRMEAFGQSLKDDRNISRNKKGEYFFSQGGGKWEKPSAGISNDIIQNAKSTNEIFGTPIIGRDNKKVAAATQTVADKTQEQLNEMMKAYGYEEDVKNKTFKPSFGQKRSAEAERKIAELNSFIPEGERGKVRAADVIARKKVDKELGIPETLKGSQVEKELESYAKAAFVLPKGATDQEKLNMEELKKAYESVSPDKGIAMLELTQSTQQTGLLESINQGIIEQPGLLANSFSGISQNLTASISGMSTNLATSISASIEAAIEKSKSEEENLKVGQLIGKEKTLAGQSGEIDSKIEKLKQQAAASNPEDFFPGGKYSNPAAVAAMDQAVGTGQDLNKISKDVTGISREDYIKNKSKNFRTFQSFNSSGNAGALANTASVEKIAGEEYDRKKLIANELARGEKAQKDSENIQNEIKKLESEKASIEGEKQKITKQISPEQRTKFEKSIDEKNKPSVPLAAQPAATFTQPSVGITQSTPAAATPESQAIYQASDSANKAKILQKFKDDEINSFMDQYTKFDKEGNVTFDPRTGFESQDEQDEFNKKYIALKKMQSTYTLAGDSGIVPAVPPVNNKGSTAGGAPTVPVPEQANNKNEKPQVPQQQNTPENTAQLISNILQVVQKIATDFEQRAAGTQPGQVTTGTGTGSGNGSVSVSTPVNLTLNSSNGENKTDVANVADKIKSDLTSFLSSPEFIDRVTSIAKQATGDKQPPKQIPA